MGTFSKIKYVPPQVRARVPAAADRVPKQEAAARLQKGVPEAVHAPSRARLQDTHRGERGLEERESRLLLLFPS